MSLKIQFDAPHDENFFIAVHFVIQIDEKKFTKQSRKYMWRKMSHSERRNREIEGFEILLGIRKHTAILVVSLM